MSDVTIPAEVARRIAGVLRFHAETVPRSPAGEQWSALADLLDPGEQPKPVCQWGECDRPVQARGYCKTHYTSARRYRGMKRIDLSESERFWAKVRIAGTPSGCWVWEGARSKKGYGNFWTDAKKSVRAHRWAWEQANGPIPDGLVIDHLCRHTSCVNPSHLEAVTPGENTLRGYGPTAMNARKTECVRGHSLSGDNLYVDPDGNRNCRACRRLREATDATPPLSLRDEVARLLEPLLLHDTSEDARQAADAVLAVVRRHVEALPGIDTYDGELLGRDDVLRLLNGGGK